ncbi:MAG TPA: ABC transporter ATP-binding protein [Mycobacteriales bacterium]|nr:ABC transporter ATP-binding protein [Mycobacteriales bacterium]
MSRLRERQEWKFFAVLTRADRGLGTLWWVLLVLRALIPVAFAVAMGTLVAAVQDSAGLTAPLVFVGVTFVLMQVLTPIHAAVSFNLGSVVSAWLFDRLTDACVTPPGMGHLEDPELAGDLTVAREFDLGMTGPPMFMNVDFISVGLVDALAGLASVSVLFAYSWWAPLLLGGAWLTTHWLLRESAVWKDRNTDEVREAQRHADYAYRLAVDPPAAKELRLFGLAGWTVERFLARRKQLYALQYDATRLREKPVLWCVLVVVAANLAMFWSLADSAASGELSLARTVIFAQAAIGASLIAFGGLNWALDGAAAPVAAVLRLESAMAARGSLRVGTVPLDDRVAREVRFRDVTFAYPHGEHAVLDGFDLTIEAGTSLAIVGQNGAGKTTLAKLLCRLYDPQSGAVEIDGTDLRDLDVEDWRRHVTAVFQDFIRFEMSLRANVAPGGAPDEEIRRALADAGADTLADLDTPLAKGYPGGTDLSGGQWQRVALARALCAVRSGAGLVLLDEPTAQLDVRGEAEIFERILRATRGVTTVLISHRFSTVRQVDRICVLEHGKVVELGSHEELMAQGGRYRTMFELQASRFDADEDEGVVLEALA